LAIHNIWPGLSALFPSFCDRPCTHALVYTCEPGALKWFCYACVCGSVPSIFNTTHDKEILDMAIPSYSSMLLDPIAGFIDTSFMGRMASGSLSLAGVGIANTILNYFGFTFFFMVVTTTVCVASTLAQSAYEAQSSSAALEKSLDGSNSTAALSPQQDSGLSAKRKASRVIGNAIFLSLCIGLASATVAGCYAPNFVSMIASKNSAAAFPFAITYMRIKALSIPPLLCTFALTGAYRGYKDLRKPLVASFVATLTKIFLDFLFLYVLKVGVAGAAISDVLSKLTSVVMLTYYLVRDQRLNLLDILHIPSGGMIKELLAPGIVLTSRKIIEQMSFTATTGLSTQFGPVATAGMQIVRQVK
jgi:putative MATE family efflux protein